MSQFLIDLYILNKMKLWINVVFQSGTPDQIDFSISEIKSSRPSYAVQTIGRKVYTHK